MKVTNVDLLFGDRLDRLEPVTGWKPPPTKRPDAHMVAQWKPSNYVLGKMGRETTEASSSTSTTTSTTTTTTASIETIDIDYDALVITTPLPTTISIKLMSTTSQSTTESFENFDEPEADDRFDFDENLYAPTESDEDDFDFSQMANDFVEYESEEEEIEEFEVPRSPKVTKPRIVNKQQPVRNIVDENAQLDLASLGVQNEKAVTINIFNNQVYNQNASGTARLVNNHGQDLTFGDKFGEGVIPPGANMGQRGQIRSMQHMVEELVHNGRNDEVMRQV